MVKGHEAKHIVVMEDEADISELLQVVLQDEGYEPEIVDPTGADLNGIARRHVDLILLEIHPTWSDPFAVLDRLAAHPGLSRVPVVCLSSLATAAQPALARPNVVGLVAQPFDIADLLDSVRQALSKR